MESLSGWWTNKSTLLVQTTRPLRQTEIVGDQSVCVSSSRVDVDEQVRGIGGKAAGPCREPELAAGGMLFLSQRCWCWRLSMALPTHM